MKVLRSGTAVFAALAIVLAAVLAPARADDSERSRIAKERADIDARYAERERACRERFVVSSCIEDAKRERRQGHDALRARQLKLDEESRHERAAARRAELAAKAAEDARREQERAAGAASAASGARGFAPRPLEPNPHRSKADGAAQPNAPHDRPLSAAERLGIRPTVRASAEERRASEERSRASYEARQRQAAEHREEVIEKANERLKSRPAAAPLPLPAVSAPPRPPGASGPR